MVVVNLIKHKFMNDGARMLSTTWGLNVDWADKY